jgi:hypothetical protein
MLSLTTRTSPTSLDPGRHHMSQLHPWLSTPEAVDAARQAAYLHRTRLSKWANVVGLDELESQALVILTECGQPKPRDMERTECAHCGGSLAGLRRGAKFCGRSCKSKYAVSVQRGKEETLPASTHAHIGCMWDWPAESMALYARTQIHYVLMNYLRGCNFIVEIRASDTLSNMDLPADDTDEDPRELVIAYLESHGIRVDGSESFDELATAALCLRNHELRKAAA